jgi:EAL domain-containing protein (putative c-di-GMP-specific phosphodiesterase class I)
MNALTQPHRLASLELHITVSIGISVFPDDGGDAETLLTRADMALYHAKDEGRDCYRFFESHLNERAVERQSIEASLHRALAQQEFELVFQPKILLNTNAIAGVEALIRWRHPERGLISPGQFVGIAEDCGLIKAIGFWVLQEACTQARAWQDAGFADISVAVNISAIEFRNEAFLPYLAGVLSQTGLDPGHLEIELTESVLMAHVDHANSVLHALKALGVRLAIDDFGTGWSSLSYLRTFPIDALKIDRSFVQAMALDSDASSIIRAVISMGKSLRHRVIAEGVETAAQLAFLLGEGCDEAQGYYLSPPVSAAECTAMLTRGDLPHLPTQHVASATLPAVARVDDGRLHVNSNIA